MRGSFIHPVAPAGAPARAGVGASLAVDRARLARATTQKGILRWSQVSAFLLGALQLGSALRWARLDVGGMLVHPYLIFVALAGFPVVVRRWQVIPEKIRGTMLVFIVAFVLATVLGGARPSIVLKLCASLLTFLFAALVVRRPGDHAACVLGLILALAGMSVRGLAGFGGVVEYGINPMEGVAQKNNFSLFAAPALFLVLPMIVSKETKKRTRLVLGLCALVTLVAVFSTANRAGWLAVLLIPFLLQTRGSRAKLVTVVVAVAAVTFSMLERLEMGGVVSYKIGQTREGYSSDTLRLSIWKEGVKIALDNPLFGATVADLDDELGRRIYGSSEFSVGPHNVWVLLLAGGGVLVFGSFIAFASTLWRLPEAREPAAAAHGVGSDARILLRRLTILWAVHGMFTDEILYAPAYSVALGLLLGLHLCELASAGAASSRARARLRFARALAHP